MQTETKRLKRKKLLAISTPEQAAKAVDLVYVNDKQPGISRMAGKNGFIYKYLGKTVTDKLILNRIKRIVIPPAWTNVWICSQPHGHIQATGFDILNRKQYRYHPSWNELRNHTKFSQLYEFGKALPAMRQRIKSDLALHNLCLNKVLAAAVSIMQCTCMRVGNNFYEKLYGSFGLTTLKDKHVKINGAQVQFSFKGKKGIYHTLSLKSKKLASIIKQCRDIPGKELFQYYDSEGVKHTIDSGLVNNYIKEISAGSFTAKDFRTWAGTLQSLKAFRELGIPATEAEAKRNIVTAIDTVAQHLGNTRAVCKKYYVHPAIIDMYANKTLDKHLQQAKSDNCTIEAELDADEQLLMNILGNDTTVVVI